MLRQTKSSVPRQREEKTLLVVTVECTIAAASVLTTDEIDGDFGMRKQWRVGATFNF